LSLSHVFLIWHERSHIKITKTKTKTKNKILINGSSLGLKLLALKFDMHYTFSEEQCTQSKKITLHVTHKLKIKTMNNATTHKLLHERDK
jgi:hypothetical protein